MPWKPSAPLQTPAVFTAKDRPPPVFAMLNQLTQVSEVYAAASHSPLTQPQKGKELLLGHCRSGAVTAA